MALIYQDDKLTMNIFITNKTHLLFIVCVPCSSGVLTIVTTLTSLLIRTVKAHAFICTIIIYM